MYKNCVIFFNCHGSEICKQLTTSYNFTQKYKVTQIALYQYLPGFIYSNNNDLISEHKELIQNCDLIILQFIKKMKML